MPASAVVLLVTAATLSALAAFTAAHALTGSLGAAAAAATGAAAAIAWGLRRHPALRPQPLPARAVRVLSVVASLVVVAELARLTVFITDVSRPQFSTAPWNAWIVNHSCVSAYWAAGREAGTIPDLYGEGLSTAFSADGRIVYRRLGPLYADPYEYPPTFLLLPRALGLLAPDFFDFRRLWFALNLAAVALGLAALARRLEPACGPSALWLSPIVLAPIAIVSTLQVGNVQLACAALAVLALLAMESEDRPLAVLPGALALAFATVSKLWPGLLVVYLLARRRWRAAAWTVAWGVVLAIVGLVDLGVEPHRAFLDQLPRLLSGEAFPALAGPRGTAGNMSVPGIVFKLGVVYGVPGMSYGAARVAGWAYTLALLAVTILLARRPLPPEREPLAWLALLTAATLRSPLLPPYGAFAPLWLAVVLLATSWNRPRARTLAFLAVLVFTPVTPNQTLLPPAVHAVVTFVQTGVALALVGAVARMGERGARE